MWASGVFHRRHNLRNTEEVQVLTPLGESQGGEPVGESQGGESGESAAKNARGHDGDEQQALAREFMEAWNNQFRSQVKKKRRLYNTR